MEQRPLHERLMELSISELSMRLKMGLGESYNKAIRRALAAKRGHPEPETVPHEAPTTPIPRVSLTLPWDMLATDNYNELINPKHKLYRASKHRARQSIQEQYAGGDPIVGPVHVDVALHLPNERDFDPTNFWKLIADALKGIVVKDDAWRYMADNRIRVAGLDRARPRAEVTVCDVQSAPPPV